MKRSSKQIVNFILDKDDYEFVLQDVNSRRMQLRAWMTKAVGLMRKKREREVSHGKGV